MKTTRLQTHWTAEDAHAVIEFLDVLRDQLWEIYGDMVVDMLRDASEHQAPHEDQVEFDFYDEINF